jgi:hypothetical protein
MVDGFEWHPPIPQKPACGASYKGDDPGLKTTASPSIVVPGGIEREVTAK